MKFCVNIFVPVDLFLLLIFSNKKTGNKTYVLLQFFITNIVSQLTFIEKFNKQLNLVITAFILLITTFGYLHDLNSIFHFNNLNFKTFVS